MNDVASERENRGQTGEGVDSYGFSRALVINECTEETKTKREKILRMQITAK